MFSIARKLKSLLTENTCDLCGISYPKGETHNCDAICLICKQVFENDAVVQFCNDCGTPFHQDQLQIWYSSHDSCPVCRLSLRDEFGDIDTCLFCLSDLISDHCEQCNRGCMICDKVITLEEPTSFCQNCKRIFHETHNTSNDEVLNKKVEGIGLKSYKTSRKRSFNFSVENEICILCRGNKSSSESANVTPIRIKPSYNYIVPSKPETNRLDAINKINYIFGGIFILLQILFGLIYGQEYLFDISTNLALNIGITLLLFSIAIMGWLVIYIVLDFILRVLLSNILLPYLIYRKVRKSRFTVNVTRKIDFGRYTQLAYYMAISILFFYAFPIYIATSGSDYANDPFIVILVLFITSTIFLIGLISFFIGVLIPRFKNYLEEL